MKTTIELLTAVKKAAGISSDYELAHLLGVTPQAVSNWRRGISYLDDFVAVRVAEILKCPALHALAVVHAERANRPEVAQVWQQIAARSNHHRKA